MVPDLTLAESHRLLILFTAYCSLVLFQWHDDMVSFFHSKSWFISKPSCWEIREILCRSQMEQKWHRIMHLWHFLDSPKILQVGSFLIALCAAASIICNLARSLPSKFQALCAEYKLKTSCYYITQFKVQLFCYICLYLSKKLYSTHPQKLFQHFILSEIERFNFTRK